MSLGAWILIGVFVVLVLWVIGTYNKLVGLKNRLDESFSTMDVYLKKRFDLIPNLVETVKGYAKHESQTLENVIAARNKAVSSTNMDERIENEGGLTQALGRLFALAESYPELKADTQFLDLQRQLQQIENDIAQARKFYNANVKIYNTYIMRFPPVLLAGMFGFKKAAFFAIDETERQNVKVTF